MPPAPFHLLRLHRAVLKRQRPPSDRSWSRWGQSNICRRPSAVPLPHWYRDWSHESLRFLQKNPHHFQKYDQCRPVPFQEKRPAGQPDVPVSSSPDKSSCRKSGIRHVPCWFRLLILQPSCLSPLLLFSKITSCHSIRSIHCSVKENQQSVCLKYRYILPYYPVKALKY